MLKRHLFLPVLASLAWGQLTPNSITVTASRNTNLQPDEVIFGVSADSTMDATREDVIAALQGSGITAANFSSVRNGQIFDPQGAGPQVVLVWNFILPAPISSMKSTIDLLSTVKKNIAGKKDMVSMSFGPQGVRVSDRLQRSQSCSIPDLVTDARAQAQKMAGAAGKSVGSILAVFGSTSATESDSTALFASPAYYPVCSLTVKFALGGF